MLESCGAAPGLIEPLLAYGDQPCRTGAASPPEFPLPDEPQIDAWRRYEHEAQSRGAVTALRRHLVQLRFPVRADISADEAYREATRKGRFAAAERFEPGIVLKRPASVQLRVTPTIAGHVPVIVAGEREDFETLVQALSARNEPVRVPPAMGACLVKGLNNWSRVADYRHQWESRHPGEDWAQGFAELIPQKSLYQDRFIILSTGPYSGTAAADAGLDEPEWLRLSLVIRREHELTHYFVYRVFDVMRTHVFDETVADFIGIARALGAYRTDLALRFLGLEKFPEYRAGGRLEVYLTGTTLSPVASEVVRTLVYRAVGALGALSAKWPCERWSDLSAIASLTFALSQLTLEELASEELPGLLEQNGAAGL